MITLSMRKANIVNVVIPLREGVANYKVYVSNNLANAYDPSGLVNIFDARANKVFFSPTIKNRTNPKYELGVNRKITRLVFDPMDYYDPTTNTPKDDQQIYLRVQEVNENGSSLGFSPILIIPPPNFFMYPTGAITLVHNAVENNGGVSVGDLPHRSDLSVIVPNYLNFFRIFVPQASAKALLYSPNAGMPYVPVPVGGTLNLFSIANNQLFFASEDNAGVATMSIFLTCSLDPIDG